MRSRQHLAQPPPSSALAQVEVDQADPPTGFQDGLRDAAGDATGPARHGDQPCSPSAFISRFPMLRFTRSGGADAAVDDQSRRR